MVEVTIEVAADEAVRSELFDWIARMPRVDELDMRDTGSAATATLHSPPQLATLAMAAATFLKMKPAGQRPVVTVTADNGESLEVTDRPDPDAIRRTYIAMDKQPPPTTPGTDIDVIDAEIAKESSGSTTDSGS